MNEPTKKSWLKLEKDFDDISDIFFGILFKNRSKNKNYLDDYKKFYREYLKLQEKVYKYLK